MLDQQKQTGFAAVLVVVVLVVALAGVVTYLFVANGNDGETDMDTKNTTQSAEESSQDNEDSSPSQSQNDNIRRSAIGQLLAATESYAANNNGVYPTADSIEEDLLGQAYLDSSDFTDPVTGETFVFTSGEPEIGEIQYSPSASCSGDEPAAVSNARRIAVRTKLESGEFYCQDNS